MTAAIEAAGSDARICPEALTLEDFCKDPEHTGPVTCFNNSSFLQKQGLFAKEERLLFRIQSKIQYLLTNHPVVLFVHVC